jgi:hypothetical protein
MFANTFDWWDYMTQPVQPRQPRQTKKDLHFDFSIDASSRVWRIFFSFLISATIGGGGYGLSYLNTKLDQKVAGIQEEITFLHNREEKRTILLLNLQNKLQDASSTAKEPIKTKLYNMSRDIKEHLDREKQENDERARHIQPGVFQAPTRRE